MDLYYLHFNNYYNRIVKKFDTLAEYLVSPYYDGTMTQNAAFNPNDSVETVQIANNAVGDYDYMIAANGYDIVSRWFIMESKRKRTGQSELSLRRDLFADSLPGILNAPAFIEKATLSDDDPLIFNKEDMTVNQIKTSETLLKDKTQTPWIVGYIPKTLSGPVADSITLSVPEAYSTMAAFQTAWNSIKYTENSSEALFADLDNDSSIKLVLRTGIGGGRKYTITSGSSSYINQLMPAATLSATPTNAPQAIAPYMDSTNFANIKNTAISYYNIQDINTDISDIMQWDNKIVDDNGVFKVIKINKYFNMTGTIGTYVTTGTLYNVLHNITTNNTYVTGDDSWNETYEITIKCSSVTYTTQTISNVSVSYSFSDSDVNKLQDAPYIMFAIPYEGCTFTLGSPATDWTVPSATANSVAMSVANSIIEKLNGAGGADALYDIQILPYCPFVNNIDADGKVVFGNNTKYYSFIKDTSNNNVGIICFATNARFEFNIPYNIPITDTKLQNQCDMYRLCSPNWNGQFEFSAAKNGGVNYINVDCEYKPYQPYIHLNPDFGLLYGQDYNDARGLVCSGDFALTQISDAWASYERQNVNYQKSFDRQIQNMEVNNNIQNIKTATQAVTGTVTGILGGLFTGGIGGAIAGGTASAIGGAMDYALQRAGQAEAIDYTKDQFGYNLGNIKALPDSLTKVSALNNNNKLFPVLEYYTCTDAEKQAFQNKIKYNGMTVMRIGTIQEFLRSDLTYIKGKFIRITDVEEDFHYINELANEFNKGVFIS